MSTLFAQVAEVFTRRQEKKIEDREALVKSILDGGKKAPTAAQIATALDEMGWTPEALEKEIARRQQRRDEAAALAEIPALEKEKAELERKGAAEVARFDALVKPLQDEHAKNMEAVNGRYRYVVMRIPQAEAMRNKLLASYSGPLEAQLIENREEQARLNREISTANKTAQMHEDHLQFSEPGELTAAMDKTDWVKVKESTGATAWHQGMSPEEIKSAKEIAATCRQAAADKKKELAALVKREAEIMEEMLQP